MSDLQVSIGESIGVYFGMFLSGESVPGIGSRSVKKLFLDTSFCSMLYSITQTVLCESGFHNVSLKVVILI